MFKWQYHSCGCTREVGCPTLIPILNDVHPYLWWIPDPSNHLLDHLSADFLPWFAHTNGDVAEQRWVADVGGVTVADDVGGPLVLGCICVTGSDVAGLKGFEVLKSAELVGHFYDRASRCLEISDPC